PGPPDHATVERLRPTRDGPRRPRTPHRPPHRRRPRAERLPHVHATCRCARPGPWVHRSPVTPVEQGHARARYARPPTHGPPVRATTGDPTQQTPLPPARRSG